MNARPGQSPRPAPPPPVPLHVERRSGADPVHTRLLLLHGLASSAAVWDETWRRPPAGLEIWTAELPWRGDHVRPWSHDTQQPDWIEAALDLVPGGPDVVVAHSFSATLLLASLSARAAAGDDLVRRYGLRGAVFVAPFYRRSPDDFPWDAMAAMQDQFLHVMGEGIRTRSGKRIRPDLRRNMTERVCERVGAYGWLRFCDSYLRTPWLHTDLITLPSLVTCGSEDFAVRESELLAADLPGARLHLFEGCGHYPMAERAQQFADLVGTFLDDLPDGPVPPGPAADEQRSVPCPTTP
ncbi:alpha/beta hydrolase [Streptomyces sp. FXJ1.172]|uniref:alpha/beta fold hydrolase n=1 Tax=Streptomyces sp. FXJ1.172 TaxID=710705 RepID=UPI0013317F9F|nr:alpha/beta hydrolase [Streptomyces sp. FXJ1.172]WEO94740.1 alpha/beta hydrolase [Streptomyces sp. FXJ1.172]